MKTSDIRNTFGLPDELDQQSHREAIDEILADITDMVEVTGTVVAPVSQSTGVPAASH